MMTPAMLERATQAFRRGYRNARDGKRSAANDYVQGSFARHDYEEGYDAAQTELRIERERAARKRQEVTEGA